MTAASPLASYSTRAPLAVSQAVTLFHEWGHALHALFSTTNHQHISGTRSSLDFVETPSSLMELFALDARVLQAYAKHWQTGASLSSSVLSEPQCQKWADCCCCYCQGRRRLHKAPTWRHS